MASRSSTHRSFVRLWQLALCVGLLGGTLAPGGAARAAPNATTPVAAPPEQASPPASQALQSAREHAAADEHTQAISDYLQAFAAEPSLVPLYADELGYQYTWNDDPDKALPWFQKRLAAAPGDVEARVGYARALSWSDRTYEGWQEYRRVLVGHPDLLEARLGEAQTLSWLGRNRQAAYRYQAILDDHPESHEARLGLAQSWAWADETQLALSVLDPMRGDEEADALRQRILSAQQPELVARSRLVRDSDQLTILGNELALESTTPRWRDLKLALLQGRFWQDGQPDIADWGLSAGGAKWLSVASQIHAYLTAIRFTSDQPVAGGPAENVDFTLLSWDAWFTWWAAYRWRLDISTDRSYVDTPRALSEKISITSLATSADWQLRPNLVWSTVARFSDYSDGNTRSYATTGLRYSQGRRWRWSLIPSLTVFKFSRRVDHGYWNPEDFFNATASAQLEAELGPRLGTNLELGLGHEWADGEDYGVLHASANLDWRLGDLWSLELAAATSNSRLSSSGGYERRVASLAIHRKF